jgi:hypothetical protein
VRPTRSTVFPWVDRGTEKWAVYLPKTPIGMRKKFNFVLSVLELGGRIRLVVNEGIHPDDHSVIYELDHSLRPVNAVLSGDLITEYKQLQNAGKVPKESPNVTAKRLMGQVRIINGNGS